MVLGCVNRSVAGNAGVNLKFKYDFFVVNLKK